MSDAIGVRPPRRAAFYEPLVERGWIPDWAIRFGIRRLLASRLRSESSPDLEEEQEVLMGWIETLRASAIAPHSEAANDQHYEVATDFFRTVLGPRLKYSCCLWSPGIRTLAEAEEEMLARVCERSRLADGQVILDLGCGWGSFALYAAERYPLSKILALSNSRTQRAYIESERDRRGLSNLEVVTGNVAQVELEHRFDRIVSIEMFEHMRNYEALFARLANWAKPRALLFVHVFCHRRYAYPFEAADAGDWMAANFFTGGQMPSRDLLLYFQRDFSILDQWLVGGRHYAQTCRAWLERLDGARAELRRVLEDATDPGTSRRELWRWRIFLLACEELFAYHGGREWFVSHYLFEKK